MPEYGKVTLQVRRELESSLGEKNVVDGKGLPDARFLDYSPMYSGEKSRYRPNLLPYATCNHEKRNKGSKYALFLLHL